MNFSSTKPLQPESRQRRFPFGEEIKIRWWSTLAFWALRLLAATTRKSQIGGEAMLDYWQRGEQIIITFWHGRILFMPFPYRGKKACIMNSAHRDGEIITRVIKRFGISAVRGSSTRGWMGGLKGMLDAYQQGYDLVVIPDGPRGPRCQAKSGIIQLARATGATIFPVSYSAAWKATIGSWDRLMIPFPFSRILYVVGTPIRVPAEAAKEVVEEKRHELETELNRISAQADSYFASKTAGEREVVVAGTPQPLPPR
ncbi:MAG: DUF374 domain-containing protein [Deltaproteobacteria bacterium]|nr:DUF374 domain-containing protein [Deltaproteobacteria bacterium]